MIDTVGLSPEQIAAIEEQAAVERKLAKLRQEAREKREAEEKARQEQLKADQEARRQKQEAEIENEIKRRYLATGATVGDWDRERGRLIAVYREEIALGRRQSDQDRARAESFDRLRKGF